MFVRSPLLLLRVVDGGLASHLSSDFRDWAGLALCHVGSVDVQDLVAHAAGVVVEVIVGFWLPTARRPIMMHSLSITGICRDFSS